MLAAEAVLVQLGDVPRLHRVVFEAEPLARAIVSAVRAQLPLLGQTTRAPSTSLPEERQSVRAAPALADALAQGGFYSFLTWQD